MTVLTTECFKTLVLHFLNTADFCPQYFTNLVAFSKGFNNCEGLVVVVVESCNRPEIGRICYTGSTIGKLYAAVLLNSFSHSLVRLHCRLCFIPSLWCDFTVLGEIGHHLLV